MSRGEYRHELKFICSEVAMQLIENKVKHICDSDPHAGEDGKYRIKSLYFDTYDDRCYEENKAGTDNRHKYRIRIYNDDTEVIKLEKKSSLRGLKCKEACNITRKQCEQILTGGAVEDIQPNQEVLGEFLLEKQLLLLSPKVIVEYERTPYIYPIGNVRITFDRYITSSDCRDFFEKDALGRGIMPQDMHILEVKYDEILPYAILELINSVGNLSRTSFSKYALCRDYSVR